jgi:hypothetical protein
MALGAALASGSCELLLLLKAVTVAVWAPDLVMPSPTLPGVSGLLCTFVAITTSLCSSLVTGLAIRWLIHRRGLPAPSKADEETAGSEATRPLLAASWEAPENNKRIGAGGKDAVEGEQKPLQPGTVLELVRMTVPDMPVLLFAFLFGVAAALMAACVPYFTGLIIDYASIDPDRCALVDHCAWRVHVIFANHKLQARTHAFASSPAIAILVCGRCTAQVYHYRIPCLSAEVDTTAGLSGLSRLPHTHAYPDACV